MSFAVIGGPPRKSDYGVPFWEREVWVVAIICPAELLGLGYCSWIGGSERLVQIPCGLHRLERVRVQTMY
jgi:hypothetical protein